MFIKTQSPANQPGTIRNRPLLLYNSMKQMVLGILSVLSSMKSQHFVKKKQLNIQCAAGFISEKKILKTGKLDYFLIANLPKS